MQFRGARGSEKILTVWLASGAALGCLLTGILLGIWGCAILPIGIVVLPAVSALLVWYPKRFVAGILVRVNQSVLHVKTGVWWQKELAIPIESLRTVEVIETPLQRRYGCAHVWLRFTGGLAVLPFLHTDDVKRFRHFLEDT